MLRQLLTLLAVISGFTLSAEPVRAAQADVVSMAQAAEAADCAATSARPLELVESAASRNKRANQPCIQPTITVQVPTVQLRVDRSRE